MLYSRGKYWRLLLIAVVALGLPLIIPDPFFRHIMIMTLMYACLGEAWNIVGGYAGQIALSNAVFFGLGGYTSAVVVTKFGLSPWLGIPAGMTVSVAAALIMGYPSFKTSGIYFAIATLGFGELVSTLFLNWKYVDGAVGIELPILPSSLLNFQFHGSKLPYYYIVLAWFVTLYWLVRRIGASRLGYYLRTLTASEIAAESVGIDVSRSKMSAFVLSAALSAPCGAFYVQYLLYIDPYVVFPSTISMFVLLTTVLGGSGTAIGPLIGAAILVPLRELTRAYLGRQGTGIDVFIYAVLVVIMAVAKPGGLVQLLPKARARQKEDARGEAA